MPIAVPKGVSVEIKDNNEVTVKGPKGELSQRMSEDMTIVQEAETVTVSRPSDSKQHRSLHGLTRALLYNMVHGTSQGFERHLDIVGVGYRAEQAGANLTIRVGYSHPVTVEAFPRGYSSGGKQYPYQDYRD